MSLGGMGVVFVVLIVLLFVLFLYYLYRRYYTTTNTSTIVLHNNTGKRKNYRLLNPLTHEVIFSIDNGSSRSFPLPRSGVRDIIIEAKNEDEPVTRVHFTAPCTADSCSSRDNAAYVEVDIDFGFSDSILIETKEGEKVTYKGNVFTKRDCPSGYNVLYDTCLSPCYNDEAYCDKKGKLYKRTQYRDIARVLERHDLPFTTNTTFSLFWY